MSKKEKILDAAIKTWPDLRLQVVAKEAGVTHPNILYHFPNGTLRDAVAEHAVKTDNSSIILQLFAEGHKAVSCLKMPDIIRHFNKV